MQSINLKKLFIPALGIVAMQTLTANVALASLITIPASSLKSSPGVYTAGGYYSDDIGANIVTTGGGNASNIGGSNGRNDDGYMALNLGFNVTFFGSTYSSLYINNNGNVSFGSGISAYVPTGPTGANAPLISPFFSDVDTRNAASGLTHYNLSANQLLVTWDTVGWFGEHGSPTNSFQLVLRADDFLVPTGEGLIGFFYKDMGWDSTDTNGVSAVGFGDGSGNGEVIEGSLLVGLDDILENKYVWFDANLDVVEEPPEEPSEVPEPATLALLGLGLAGLGFSKRKKA